MDKSVHECEILLNIFSLHIILLTLNKMTKTKQQLESMKIITTRVPELEYFLVFLNLSEPTKFTFGATCFLLVHICLREKKIIRPLNRNPHQQSKNSQKVTEGKENTKIMKQ